jgi:predicted MFS family arabinose efflux permease
MTGETTQPTNSRRVRPAYALTLLALASFMNYLDRMVLPAVAQPIKLEFGLSDSELGLLTGFAFVLLYAFSGVPLSRLADRTSRPLVLALSLAFWSVATGACGFARNFWQLLLARACVGIGESTCQPVGYAIVGDHYDATRRTTAIAWFLVGNSLGVTAGFAIGGWIGAMYGWRAAFIAVAIPGLLLAIAISRLPSSARATQPPHAGTNASSGFWSDLKSLWSRRPYRWLIGLNAIYSCTLFGPIAWLPAFFMRSHALPMQVAGPWTGLAIGGGMGCGMLVGGLLADRLYRGGRHRPQWLGCVTVLLSALVFFAALSVASPTAAISLTFAATLLGSMGSPVNATSIQNESPDALRATAASLATLAVGVIGIGLAPWLIGVLSDGFTASHGSDGLRVALQVSLALSVVTALLYLQMARILRASTPLAPLPAAVTAR